MKNPFDVAVAALQRKTDDIRRSITIIADQLSEIDNARSALSIAIQDESLLAAKQWDMPSAAYLTRLCAARERLSDDHHRCEAKLAEFRDQALASYASLQALESAAQNFTSDADRASDVAEQASFDDISASRFARSLRLAREPQRRHAT